MLQDTHFGVRQVVEMLESGLQGGGDALIVLWMFTTSSLSAAMLSLLCLGKWSSHLERIVKPQLAEQVH